jgi:hypothetical protein
MITSFFVPAQANISNNRAGLSFKGAELNALKKIVEGKISSNPLSILVEGPVPEKVTRELQEAFNAAYRTGKCRQTLDAYATRKAGLTKPKE